MEVLGLYQFIALLLITHADVFVISEDKKDKMAVLHLLYNHSKHRQLIIWNCDL